MTFDEAFDGRIGFGLGIDGSITGYLVVCQLFSYLSERPAVRLDDPPGRTILIADPDIASGLLAVGCPVSVGSMCAFSGKAMVHGTVVRSGLGVFPIAFATYREIRFLDQDGSEYVLTK